MGNITVGGWVTFIIILVLVLGFALYLILEADLGKVATAVISVISMLLIFGTLLGLSWYYSNTASGLRAVKSQESNFNLGIKRSVSVYDMNGGLIKTYEGKFDVDYDNDRIIFDDENGLRHIIYYPTGTVIIDEIP